MFVILRSVTKMDLPSKKEKKKRIEGVSHQSKSPDVRMEDETRRAATSADGPESGDREVAAFLFVWEDVDVDVALAEVEEEVEVVELPGSGVPLLCARTISAAVSAKPYTANCRWAANWRGNTLASATRTFWVP